MRIFYNVRCTSCRGWDVRYASNERTEEWRKCAAAAKSLFFPAAAPPSSQQKTINHA